MTVGSGSAPISANQRRRIVAAIPGAISEYGYERATVARIIAPAGVSRRTFYDLFADRGKAFRVAHAVVLRSAASRVEMACEGEGEWPRKVEAAVRAALEWAAAQPERALLISAQPHLAGPHTAHCHDRLVERFAPGLRQGRRLYRLDPPPVWEEALIGGLASIVAARLSAGQAKALPDLAGQLVEFALAPYRTIAGAAR